MSAHATLTTHPTAAPPAHHPVRGRINSAFFHMMNGYLERKVGPLRDQITAAVRDAGEIVEVGPGNGPLFARLPDGARVHAIEPNRAWHARLCRSAERTGTELVLHTAGAESIDLPDGSVDAVLSGWVLCTVADPQQVVSEIRRVLRPGGRFAFYEHVAAPDGSTTRRVQDAVHDAWAWVFDGCQTNRDTAAIIRGAGFDHVDLRDVTVRTAFVPVRAQIAGTATA